MCGAEVISRTEAAWRVLRGVMDPEVPVISLVDLGIVREVRLDEQGGEAALTVVLTPTYSGCPATEVIEASARESLEAAGLGPVRILSQRAPAWTTDWISAQGRERLREYGIAPPGPCTEAGDPVIRFVAPPVACPRCSSRQTERLSAFGATACKALHRCRACGEPFEHFKPL